jgi:hypothetical protein
MAEVAGIVLGGIPVALWALQRYHDAAKSYRNFRKYDMTLSTLRDNIFVQQQQLHITIGLIGLDQPSINELQERIQESYPRQQREIISIIGHMDQIIRGLLDKLEIDMDGKVSMIFSLGSFLLASVCLLIPLGLCKYHSSYGPHAHFLCSHHGQMRLLTARNGSGVG